MSNHNVSPEWQEGFARGFRSGLEASSTEARRESPPSSVNDGEGGSPTGQTPINLAKEIITGLENRGYMDIHFNRDDAAAAEEFIVELLQEFLRERGGTR